MPNLITQDSIENAKSEINVDCYKLLEKLLAKKHVMDFSTSKNTENITKFDIDNDNDNDIKKYDPMVLNGGAIDDEQNTKNMIKNIRHITIMLNKRLEELEKTMDVDINEFDNLNTMSLSNLPLIGASLVQTFLDSSFFKSLNDKLNLYYTNNEFLAETSSFNIVHPFTLNSNLHKFYEPLKDKDIIKSFINYKTIYTNGIHATINIVQPLDINIELAKGKKNKRKKSKKIVIKKSRKKSRKILKKTIKKVKLLTKKCKIKKYKNTKTCKKFNKIKKKFN